jgi:hypothetical protein
MCKLIFLFMSVTVLITSCKKNCNDCGPITTGRYFIKNTSSTDIKFIFFGNSIANFQKDTINIPSKDRKLILSFTTGMPSSSILRFDYNLCDSLHIITIMTKKSFKVGNCSEKLNILCTSNYSVVKEETVSNGQNSKKSIEYELSL